MTTTTANAVDALTAKHNEIVTGLQKQIEDALPLGTQMSASVKTKLEASFASAAKSWESEVKTAHQNLQDEGEPHASDSKKHGKR